MPSKKEIESRNQWHPEGMDTSVVLQGSILGPILFNISINDIFYFMYDTNITNYADDNTPYTNHINFNITIKSLECNGNIIFK